MVRNAVFSYVNPEDQSKNVFLLGWNAALALEIGAEPSSAERASWSDEEYKHLVKFLSGGDETVNTKTGQSWELQLKGAGRTPFSRFADGYAVLRSSIREYLCAEAVHTLNVPSSRSLAILSTETVVLREDGGEPGSIVCRVAPSWIRFGSFEIFFYRNDKKNLRRLAEYVVNNVFKLEMDDSIVMAQFATDFRRDEKERKTEGITKKSESTEDQKAENVQDEDKMSDDYDTSKRPIYRNRFARMFAEVARRTAIMVSGWQAIGFCHGVMNTDNMSILGLTIDYGPFAFLDKYDPTWICNHSDTEGRYAFQEQPGICLWNLGRLALTLENLIGAQEQVDDLEWMSQQEANPSLEERLKENAKDIVVDILNKDFRNEFLRDYRLRMNEKMGLGIIDIRENDLTDIVVPSLSWMDEYEVDYHQFYRQLAEYKVQSNSTVTENMEQVELFVKNLLPTPVWQSRGNIAVQDSLKWLEPYHDRLFGSEHLVDDETRRFSMNKINPAFVLRNWVAQKVIEQVTQSVEKTRTMSKEADPDKDMLDRVLWMCQNPFGDEVRRESMTVEGAVCEAKRNDADLQAYGAFLGPVPEWGQGIQCSCSS
ncbi:hypothetical protein BGZ94_002551 [Podila epigama]|nr:hypothetical protein BGZ94_002551 [Podila epigama]